MDIDKLKKLFNNNEDIQLKNAYSGIEPYIFISYSHEDKELIRPYLIVLQEEANVWYDEGIKPGENWIEKIIKKIDDCEIVFLFISNNSIKSKWVEREIQRAINKDKKIISIYLENTNLPDALQFQIDMYQQIKDKNLETFLDSIPPSVKKIDDEKGEQIYIFKNYKYLFEETNNGRGFAISKIILSNNEKEILFSMKESSAFLTAFYLHSIKYMSSDYIFSPYNFPVLSFSIYVDNSPDFGTGAPEIRKNFEFIVENLTLEYSRLIISKFQITGAKGHDIDVLKQNIKEIDNPTEEDIPGWFTIKNFNEQMKKIKPTQD
ncbi:MAG: toll/interleukin-1 receptor domain-containing protein [Candidatus Cloacimonetes bacterium]|nr:toll/interleukin-1 receptor domain-containing protein [Candidatus Cloacimonadota bacterium]